jgi:hypothetical protein
MVVFRLLLVSVAFPSFSFCILFLRSCSVTLHGGSFLRFLWSFPMVQVSVLET